MALPLVDVGAVHLTVAEVLPDDTVGVPIDGVPGVVNGVTVLEDDE